MEVTSASDVYSLGVVAFECLAGARPFDGASQVAIALAHINRPPPPLPAHVPPAVRLLVERALAKDPADRFPDGAAFAPHTGPRTGPAGSMPPLHAPGEDDWGPEEPFDEDDGRGRRRKLMWLAAAAALLLLLGGGTYFLLTSGNRGAAEAGATSASQTSAAPTGILLDPSAFIGRPADEVTATLEAAGLTVVREPADGDQLASAGQALDAGDVAALDPSGVFADPGTSVTLFVAEEAYTPDEPEETEPEETTAEQTTTSEAPEPTTTSSAPPATTTESTTTSTTVTAPGSAVTTTEEPPTEEPAAEPAAAGEAS